MPVTIVIPAYNEQDCITQVIGEWLATLRHAGGGALLVVNDGSRDQTGRLLDELAASNPDLRVIHQANAGHGAAVRRGYDEAVRLPADWIFQTDSDAQFVASDFWTLWKRKDSAEALFGIRRERHDPVHRLMVNRLMRLLVSFLFGVAPADPNVPFRLVRKTRLIEFLELIPPGVFAPNIFMSILAKRRHLTVVEIPVRHHARRSGRISIVRRSLVRACMRSAQELLDFRRRLRNVSP